MGTELLNSPLGNFHYLFVLFGKKKVGFEQVCFLEGNLDQRDKLK